MKIIVQRCEKAKVTVKGKTVGSIESGLMLLVGFTQGDNSTNIDYLVDKIINLRETKGKFQNKPADARQF